MPLVRRGYINSLLTICLGMCHEPRSVSQNASTSTINWCKINLSEVQSQQENVMGMQNVSFNYPPSKYYRGVVINLIYRLQSLLLQQYVAGLLIKDIIIIFIKYWTRSSSVALSSSAAFTSICAQILPALIADEKYILIIYIA